MDTNRIINDTDIKTLSRRWGQLRLAVAEQKRDQLAFIDEQRDADLKYSQGGDIEATWRGLVEWLEARMLDWGLSIEQEAAAPAARVPEPAVPVAPVSDERLQSLMAHYILIGTGVDPETMAVLYPDPVERAAALVKALEQWAATPFEERRLIHGEKGAVSWETATAIEQRRAAWRQQQAAVRLVLGEEPKADACVSFPAAAEGDVNVTDLAEGDVNVTDLAEGDASVTDLAEADVHVSLLPAEVSPVRLALASEPKRTPASDSADLPELQLSAQEIAQNEADKARLNAELDSIIKPREPYEPDVKQAEEDRRLVEKISRFTRFLLPRAPHIVYCGYWVCFNKANWNTGLFDITHVQLSEALGSTGRKTGDRVLAVLEACGLIEQIVRGGSFEGGRAYPSRYRLMPISSLDQGRVMTKLCATWAKLNPSRWEDTDGVPDAGTP